MPGWTADLAFQRLVQALGADLPGDGAARFRAGADIVRGLRAAGAPSLAASPIAADLDEVMAREPLAYLAHEYMATHWRPLFVTEVRAAMAEVGLAQAG